MADFEQIRQDVMFRFRGDTKGLKNALKNVDQSFAATAKRAAETQRNTRGASDELQVFGQIGSALPGQLGPAVGAVGALTGAFKSGKGSLLAYGLVATGVIGGIVKFRDEIGALITKVFSVNEAFGVYAETQREIRKQQALTIDSTQKLWDALFPKEALARLQSFEKEELQKREEAARAVAHSIRTSRILTAERTFGANSTEFLNARDDAEKAFDKQIAAIEKRFFDARGRLASRQAEQRRQPSQLPPEVVEEAFTGPPVDFSGSVLEGGFARGRLPAPVAGDPNRFSRLGNFRRADQRREREEELGRLPGEGRLEQIQKEQEAVQKAFLQSQLAITSFGQALTITSDSVVSAFEEWGSGAISLGDALKQALGNAIGDILLGEAKKHAALAAADFFTGNPIGGAGHLAAAAGLAAASGAVRSFLGADGGGASAGALPGAAAGAIGGGRGTSSELIVLTGDPDSDDPRDFRRRRARQLERAQERRGQGTAIIRA